MNDDLKHVNLVRVIPWVVLLGASIGIASSKKSKMLENGLYGALIGAGIQFLAFPAVGAHEIHPVLAPPSGSTYKYAANPMSMHGYPID